MTTRWKTWEFMLSRANIGDFREKYWNMGAVDGRKWQYRVRMYAAYPTKCCLDSFPRFWVTSASFLTSKGGYVYQIFGWTFQQFEHTGKRCAFPREGPPICMTHVSIRFIKLWGQLGNLTCEIWAVKRWGWLVRMRRGVGGVRGHTAPQPKLFVSQQNCAESDPYDQNCSKTASDNFVTPYQKS